MDIGVGTILTESEALRAIDSGAQYLVTPTMNLPVIRLAVEQIAVFPGGLTPTELSNGWNAGDSGQDLSRRDGRRRLPQASARPVPRPGGHASGGVDLDAAGEWLNAGAVAVSIGGPLLETLLKGGDLGALRDRCRAVLAVAAEAAGQ